MNTRKQLGKALKYEYQSVIAPAALPQACIDFAISSFREGKGWFVHQAIKDNSLFPRNHSTFPFVQANLCLQTTAFHTNPSIQINPAGLFKLELQSGFKQEPHKSQKVLSKALLQHFSPGSTAISDPPFLPKCHHRDLNISVCSHLGSSSSCFDSHGSCNFLAAKHYHHSQFFSSCRSFLPTSSPAATGSSRPQAQLRAN